MRTNPELARKFVAAHKELTQWLRDHPQEAQQRVRDELSTLMRKEIPLELIQQAWARLRFDETITIAPFQLFLDQARLVGFLRAKIDLANFIWTPP